MSYLLTPTPRVSKILNVFFNIINGSMFIEFCPFQTPPPQQPRPNSCHKGYYDILTLIENFIFSYKIHVLSFFIQIQQQNKRLYHILYDPHLHSSSQKPCLRYHKIYNSKRTRLYGLLNMQSDHIFTVRIF